ncbi:putative nucleic acid-binding protein [Helianthus annuus]|nr:putative nucleic acid-binding protein [Helianthus annuus]
MARLDEGLRDITVRLNHLDPPKQFTHGTRRERKSDGSGWRYALTSWKKFMKAAGIKVPTMEIEGQITLLNDIDALSTNYTIKVKIVSLWRKKMRANERETYRIDMILMDEMGTKIQAFCLHKLFSKFERHLIVDECLIIKRPSLAANTTFFKIVPNNQKLSFHYHTLVEKCKNWDGP